MSKMQHKDIWRAIDLLAESHGLSTSGLAKSAGLDPTSFNKSKRVTSNGKPRWPSTESLSKILDVTGDDFSRFVDLIAPDDSRSHNTAFAESQKEYAYRPSLPLIQESELTVTGDIEVKLQNPTQSRQFDLQVREDGVFAIELRQDLNVFARAGDRIIVKAKPITDLSRGDRLLIRDTDKNVLDIYDLVRYTPQHLTLKPLSDGEIRDVPLAEIELCFAVMMITQF